MSTVVAKAVAALTLLKLVTNAGFRFVYPFLPAIGRGLGADLGQMGVLLSVRWGVGFTVPFAVGLDRAGTGRRLLISGLIVFGLGALVTAAAGVFVGALVGFALMGLGKPVFDIGSQTYVSARVPYARRARALGILELSWAGGFLIGAPLAGWLIERWGWEMPFWAVGSLALLSLGVVFLLLDDTGHREITAPGGSDQPRRVVIHFLATVTIAGFTLEMVLVVLGTWLENQFAMTVLALAGVGFLLGAAELVGEGAMVAFTDRFGKRNSFALGLAATAVALSALALTDEVLAPALISLFFVTFSLEFALISGIPLASEYRPRNRSRFLAWFLVAGGIGRIAADLLGPVLFQARGMGAVAVTAAATSLIGVMVLLTRVKEVDAEKVVRPPL